jgi:hypothetical protein
MNININLKIDEFIRKYSDVYNTKTLDTIRNVKTCSITPNLIKNYSRTLVTNYQNKNQYVFNYIVSCTIEKTVELLEKNIDFFENEISYMNNVSQNEINSNSNIWNKLKYSRKFIKKLNNFKNNKIIKYKKYYVKLVYILFFYLGIQRSIINILQTNYSNITYISRYGIIEKNFIRTEPINMFHSLGMKRFDHYLVRLSDNIKTIKLEYNKNNKNIYLNILDNPSYTKYEIKIYLDENNSKLNTNKIENINDKLYILLDITYISNNIITKIRGIQGIPVSIISNYSESLECRLYLLNILSFYMCKMDELYNYSCINKKQNKLKNNIIKTYIIKFYYTLIFLMPFSLGTASIAEIILYSLWKKYIGYDLVLNKKIMLDVEALTLPYKIFYKNFISKTDDIGYTPYVINYM